MVTGLNRVVLCARRAESSERAICFRIRYEVFVLEQGFSPSLEPDAHDTRALHYIAYRDGEAIGAARAILDDEKPSAHIGRVAVVKSARASGAGLALMQAIFADPDVRHVLSFRLSAQMQAVSFYEKLGFQAVGEPFEAAGAPHLIMHWTREQQS